MCACGCGRCYLDLDYVYFVVVAFNYVKWDILWFGWVSGMAVNEEEKGKALL